LHLQLRYNESFSGDLWLSCALEGSAGNMKQLVTEIFQAKTPEITYKLFSRKQRGDRGERQEEQSPVGV